QQEFREVAAVLAGDAGDEGGLVRHRFLEIRWVDWRLRQIDVPSHDPSVFAYGTFRFSRSVGFTRWAGSDSSGEEGQKLPWEKHSPPREGDTFPHALVAVKSLF